MTDCKYWQDCGVVHGGCCRIHRYEKPSRGVCEYCIDNGENVKRYGAGDDVARCIVWVQDFMREMLRGRSRYHLGQVVRVLVCGCGGRQRWLNKVVPYGNGDMAGRGRGLG